LSFVAAFSSACEFTEAETINALARMAEQRMNMIHQAWKTGRSVNACERRFPERREQ